MEPAAINVQALRQEKNKQKNNKKLNLHKKELCIEKRKNILEG